MHNSRLRLGLIGTLLGFASAGLDAIANPRDNHPPVDPDQFQGPGRHRGEPYSATTQDKEQRFQMLKPSCRPPARRHYAPRGRTTVPLDMPKRMKDRRAWRKANRYLECAVVAGRYF